VPARHYFWIPKGIPHILRLGYSATVLRSLYFYSYDDSRNSFYTQFGIYPASELLIQMINYTERWDGRNVDEREDDFEFLIAVKQILPKLVNEVPLIMLPLPVTENELLSRILKYLEKNIEQPHTLKDVSSKFNISERSMSRLFQSSLHMSFLQYLKTIRMVKALELILKTRNPISEIAYSVGYETLGAFSNTFYDFTHIRPSELRKNHKVEL